MKYKLLHQATSQGYNIIYCIVKERNLKDNLMKPVGFISVQSVTCKYC